MLFTVMLNPLCVLELFLLLIENTLFSCATCSPLSPPPRLPKTQEQIQTLAEGSPWFEVGGFGVMKGMAGLSVPSPHQG